MKLGKYQHYKGKAYEVIGIAKDSENLSDIVVYRALYDDPKLGKNVVWTRKKENFEEKVVVDGKEIPRFKFIDN